MTKYEQLKKDMMESLRDGLRARRETIADMISYIEKEATSGKERVEITDAFVDDKLMKYQKQTKEQLDTCPASRADLLEKYSEKMKIVMEYAPQIQNDPEQIRKAIAQWANGKALFTSAADFRKYMIPLCRIARHDMKIAAAIINEVAKEYI